MKAPNKKNGGVSPSGLPELFTAAEVAQCLRCSTYTVYQLARDGKLESVKPTKNMMRIPKASLLKFLGE
ncbi:DNA binding domain-containing protein, excisionase family [Bifidobacterium bohemicum]|uniref:DNA binding domain protein, putative excisionase family n=1 Tax=Bifidobacterium bohemicum DSM 22767 TaxID=1437606 RepID=A0A086ZDZ8_9BIFI|nr:helix-turn-helix domain-containing protein [Bifidobacterium bohemicum]KFI44748.1 DNA binding domain protein, putative excisionase family [Bifidobacterium bohemicum DSM 22767]SCC17414.1 DNA binding domain-containing protein, excisionase family [Bifidobacterium bohemicum]